MPHSYDKLFFPLTLNRMTSLVSVSLESGILVLDKTLIRIALEGEEAEEQGQKGTQATPREPNLSSPGKLQIGS